MTPLLLILSLLSLDVGRSRTTVTPRSIERTLMRVGVGLAQSYGSEETLETLCRIIEGSNDQIQIRNPRLYVDGQRNGYALCRVLRSCYTLGLFVVDLADPGSSVELRYTLDYRGLAIARRVTITDGQVVSRASFACTLGPQGRVRSVWMQCAARESASETTIVESAGVRVHSGLCPTRETSRCAMVNRMVARQASAQLDSALAGAEREGRRLSDAGHDAICGHVTSIIKHLLRWTR